MIRSKTTASAGGLLLAISLLHSTPLTALESDRSQPITIEADRAVRNEKDGTTIYIGNVELTQGSLLMLADRLEIFNTVKKEVDRVVAYGKPAYVEQKPSPDKEVIKARANTIRYFVLDEKLILEKNASIEQQGDMLQSGTIVYYLKDEVVQANSEDKQEGSRVRMTIRARDDDGKPKESK